MLPTNSLDAIKRSKSGVLSSFIGVGTVTINILLSLISSIFDVNFEFLLKSSKFVQICHYYINFIY